MAYIKGEQVEKGIWFVKGFERKLEKLYWSEVWLKDPVTGKRIKQSKVSNRLDVLRKWWWERKNAQTTGKLSEERSQRRIKFSQLADEYYEDWSLKRKESTVRMEKNRVEGILKAYWGNWDITNITRKDVETFLRKRRDGSIDHIVAQDRRNSKKGGVTLATANRDLCRLKNMLKKAVEWGYLKENPAVGIPQEKEDIPKVNYLDRDEVSAFFAACEPEYRPLFVVAVYTGMRYGELMKLSWKDVNWDFNTLHIQKPKNNEDRYVPLAQAARSAMEELVPEGKTKDDLKESQAPIFANPETGKPYVDVRKAMRRALDKAKITKSLRFHDLRHTTGSHLAMNGSTEVEIAAFLGHKNTTVTRRYTHLSETHLQSVADRLNFGNGGKKKSNSGVAEKAG